MDAIGNQNLYYVSGLPVSLGPKNPNQHKGENWHTVEGLLVRITNLTQREGLSPAFPMHTSVDVRSMVSSTRSISAEYVSAPP